MSEQSQNPDSSSEEKSVEPTQPVPAETKKPNPFDGIRAAIENPSLIPKYPELEVDGGMSYKLPPLELESPRPPMIKGLKRAPSDQASTGRRHKAGDDVPPGFQHAKDLL